MRWRDYVALIAALIFVSWLRSVWAPGATVVVVAMLSIVLVSTLVRHHVRRHRFKRLEALSDVDRDAALDDLCAGAALARLGLGIMFRPENLGQLPMERRFAYRPGSQSPDTYLFWFCLLIALGMLVPFALGRFNEEDGPWVWIALAAVFGASAWGYRRLARNLGAELVVDREGIGIEGTEGNDCRIGWLEVAWVRSVGSSTSFYRALILGTRLGKKLVIDSQVPEFEEAIELVCRQARGGSGKAMSHGAIGSHFVALHTGLPAFGPDHDASRPTAR